MKLIPPPYSHRWDIGKPENYCIHDGYQSRAEAAYFDDTGLTDEYQLPVYLYARQLADERNYTSVLDVGCGSGYKLVQHFSDLETLGVDLPATVDYLNTRYPDRKWEVCLFGDAPAMVPDLLICADVIEHLSEPSQLLEYINVIRPRCVVLSTPARELWCMGTDDGPPSNVHHIREWSVAELHAYLQDSLVRGSFGRNRLIQHFVHGVTQIVEMKCQ